MAKLATNVLIDGKVYGPDDNVPAKIAAQITNPKAWVDGKLPAAAKAASSADTGSDSGSTDSDPDPDAPKPLDDWTVPDLKAEIDKRNADRDPDGDAYIAPDAPGNKPELVAALKADDDAADASADAS